MTELQIPEADGFLYIVADSHLDRQIAPGGEFVDMLAHLENPHTIVCLGDLFKIWLVPPKFWTDMHRDVMLGFSKLKEQGRNVVFVAGNREMLLPKKLTKSWQKKLPFTHLAHHDFILNWGKKRYGFIHGDTLNTNDLQYLRWKAVSHSFPFEMFFRTMPGPLARRIAERLETMLVQTNREHKIHFPEKEIQKFADSILAKFDDYFVGHFHTERELKTANHSGALRIVPDWLSQRTVLQISPQGEMKTLRFEETNDAPA